MKISFFLLNVSFRDSHVLHSWYFSRLWSCRGRERETIWDRSRVPLNFIETYNMIFFFFFFWCFATIKPHSQTHTEQKFPFVYNMSQRFSVLSNVQGFKQTTCSTRLGSNFLQVTWFGAGSYSNNKKGSKISQTNILVLGQCSCRIFVMEEQSVSKTSFRKIKGPNPSCLQRVYTKTVRNI